MLDHDKIVIFSSHGHQNVKTSYRIFRLVGTDDSLSMAFSKSGVITAKSHFLFGSSQEALKVINETQVTLKSNTVPVSAIFTC